MFFKFKYHYIKLFILIFLISSACQIQEPTKNHGILFLKNRSDKLIVDKSNKNDALGVVGRPHSKSIENDDKWIYLERILTKGKYHKLGQHVLKSNNVLVLTFDKFGVLKTKSFYDKDDVKKVKFSEKITENKLSKKSFVETFLSSVKEKMYSGRK